MRKDTLLSSTESTITEKDSDWPSFDHVPTYGPITCREACVTDLAAVPGVGKDGFSEKTTKKARPWQTKATAVYFCRSKVGARNLFALFLNLSSDFARAWHALDRMVQGLFCCNTILFIFKVQIPQK